MEISTRYYHIDIKTTFQGIFRYSVIREFEQFLLQLELYRIYHFDNNIIDLIRNHCYYNSTRNNILKKVDAKLTDSVKLDFFEIENYYSDLKNKLPEIQNSIQDNNKFYNFNIAGKIKIPLTFPQFKRFYFDLKSFYENYFLLETVLKIVINQDDNDLASNKKKLVDNVNQFKQEYQQEIKQEVNEEKENFVDISNQDKDKDINNIELSENQQKFIDIFELSFNPLITTSLIHNYISTYQYITSEYSYIEHKDNIKIFHIIKLFPNSFLFNTDYFKSIVMSLSKYTLNDISYFSNKVISYLQNIQEDEDPKYLIMICYLYFIYCLRYIYETHTKQFMNRFEELLTNSDSQQKVLNHFLKSYYNIDNMQFKLIDSDLSYDKSEELQLDEISKKYSYMINISQEDFINNIISNDLTKNNNLFLPNIKQPEVFNLNQILNNYEEKGKKINKLVSNNLIDKENTIDFEELEKINKDEYLLKLFDYDLNIKSEYNLNNKFITNVYRKLIEYINDPNSIYINEDQIPKQVIKYFDIIKEILNPNVLKKEDIKLISYYQIICQHFNDINVIPHTLILYIIYQIIIPYYYDFYNIVEFEDCII